VLNLLARLAHERASGLRSFAPPIRVPGIGRDDQLLRYAEMIRGKPDASALLALRDQEDGCPRADAPSLAERFRGLRLPFPVAVVLAYREYETLFLPCIEHMAGQPLEVRGSVASSAPSRSSVPTSASRRPSTLPPHPPPDDPRSRPTCSLRGSTACSRRSSSSCIGTERVHATREDRPSARPARERRRGGDAGDRRRARSLPNRKDGAAIASRSWIGHAALVHPPPT